MRSGFDLTPAAAAQMTIPIGKTAPTLVGASITSQSATGFTLVLNGFSTSRSLRQLDIQITPKQGENFASNHLTLDVNSAAGTWYQSSASQGTGGLFLAAIPFVLGNGSGTDDLVHRLASLSVTATNETGVSAAVTVPIQ